MIYFLQLIEPGSALDFRKTKILLVSKLLQVLEQERSL